MVSQAFAEKSAEARQGSPQETAPEPLGEPDVPSDVTPPESTRQRDPETGQFVSKQDDEPDPEAQPEPQTPDELAEYADLLQRYGSVPEALKAFKHQQELIGRQGQELGELRKLREQFELFQQQYQEQLRADEAYVDPQYINQVYEESPQRALTEIIEAGYLPGSREYDTLMNQWIRDEPDVALPVHTEIRLRVAEARFQEQLAQLQAPIQQQQIAQTWNQAFLSVASKNPDMDTLAPKMRELAADPFFANAVRQASSPQEYERIIEMMALTARGSALPHIQNAAVEARQQADEAARQERANAFVASSSSANREPALTAEERQKATVLAAAQQFLSPGTQAA